jgi:lipopolysaccharide/colanic/teichoic acid biosynthesis glycosyltransferase
MYKNAIKRFLDFSIALIGLVLIFPLFILVIVGLFFANQGKPFFFQLRPGKNGQLFKIIKFKTMNDKKDKAKAREKEEKKKKRKQFSVVWLDSKNLPMVGVFTNQTSWTCDTYGTSRRWPRNCSIRR